MINRYLSLVLLAVSPLLLTAQSRIGSGAVTELYSQNCMMCHGPDLKGGLGSNLVDDVWVHGGTDEDITRVIKEGIPEKGMTPYGDVLSDEQVRSLVIYLREMGQLAREEAGAGDTGRAPEETLFESQHHTFKLEKLAWLDDDIFWSVSFLPDGAMLLTQFNGKLYVYRDGKLGEPIMGTPEFVRHGQGGLLEAQAHPDYENNGWIYLGFAEKSPPSGGNKPGYMTAIIRGRIKDGQWVDQEDIFRVPAKFHKSSGAHFGTRFVFDEGYLFFSIGDRGSMKDAQDVTNPNGKIHRIHDDGRIPEDNPFVDEAGAYASIWTYGNRNPQGLDMDPATGLLWSTEHGPRGGDELNLIRKGLNYGWPVITHGMNYNGKPITGITAKEGMEQPVHYWTPGIAVCGIDFYEGDVFPMWKGDLFVAGLRSEQVERFKIEGEKIVEHEVVLKGQGRVRDISTGPDGTLYLLLNENRNGGPGGVYRLLRD